MERFFHVYDLVEHVIDHEVAAGKLLFHATTCLEGGASAGNIVQDLAVVFHDGIVDDNT